VADGYEVGAERPLPGEGRGRATPGPGKDGQEQVQLADRVYRIDPACTCDIFSRGVDGGDVGEHLSVYAGVTMVRSKDRVRFGKNNGEKRGLKKEIRTFSDKSRRNMMILMAKIERPFDFWQDFTFADDVMKGLGIRERAEYAQRCLKVLKQWMERAGIEIAGIWKKEWVRRKSGELEREQVPHFHMVYSIPGADRETYLRRFVEIARKWVDITRTESKEKALAVALHHKSYRFIESRKQMQKYMSKYMVKDASFVASESIGRNWGVLGDPVEGEAEMIDMTGSEMVVLKRCLRKIARNAKGHYKKALKEVRTQFFVFIERETIFRFLEWLRAGQSPEGVPF